MKRNLSMIVLMLVIVMPVAAQGDVETSTFLLNTVNAVLLLGFGLLLLAFVGVVIWLGGKLYKSVPPEYAGAVHEGMKGILDNVTHLLEQKKTEASANDIMWDDPIWATLYEQAKKQREALNERPQG